METLEYRDNSLYPTDKLTNQGRLLFGWHTTNSGVDRVYGRNVAMSQKKNSQLKCSECEREYGELSIRLIDDKPVCLNCLYGGIDPVRIWPIGFVVNDKKRSHAAFGTTGGDISEIRLFPGMARFMKGVADETHLTIVWQLHEAGPIKTVFRRGWDAKKVGPFASCTPDRLTPIAVTDVELLEVKGTTLTVRGLDAVDGTPVLDIKVAMESLK